MNSIIEYIGERVLLGDGAIGTEFYRRGVPKGHCYDELNLSQPALVEQIHREYIAAGAGLIETNTYGANRYILGKYYDLANKTTEICERGVKIARAATSWKNVFIAGSIGPITRVFDSEDQPDADDLDAVFSEQIEGLVSGGVDLIIFETFADLRELVTAIAAAKRIVPELPVVGSMSFTEGVRTIAGVEPSEAATKLIEAGAHIIGANCGTGPRGVFEAIKGLAINKDLLLSAIPNAGLPTFSDGRFEYESEPEYLAHYAKKYVGFGVRLIAGCCGTTPEHIAAMSDAIEGLSPNPIRKIVQVGELAESKVLHSRKPTQFEKAINNKFVHTMEIDPPKGIIVDDTIEAAVAFKSLGGDAINVSDTPMARLRMAALPLAVSIMDKANIDVILHVTARDRNLIAIQSDLLGAHSLGIDNILALRGDPPSIGDYPFATGVYDVSSEGIVSIASSFSRGFDRLGIEIDSNADFFVGVAVNQNSRHLKREFERLDAKIAAGAGVVQTQPVFDISKLKEVVDFVDGRIKVIASLMILSSERHAEFLHNEVPGISIPLQMRDSLAGKSGKEARTVGMEIAKATLYEIREIADGVCFMPPFGHYEIVRELMP